MPEGTTCNIYPENVHELGNWFKDLLTDDIKPLYVYCLEEHGDHLYTYDANEIGTTNNGAVGKYGYRCKGIAGYVHSKHKEGTIPLYRYYKTKAGSGQGDHLYTTNVQEIGTTAHGEEGNSGYVFEKIACYVFPAENNAKNDD